MDAAQEEREVRAARNQAMFRALNEQIREVNEAFASLTERFTIACECADTRCIQTLDIQPEEYVAVRAEPRHFAVLHGHLYLDVEDVIREADGYVVVEKTAKAGEVAEELADEKSR
jgi:5-bromo-4-chloroindolyl phosphate hydrolysis protein